MMMAYQPFKKKLIITKMFGAKNFSDKELYRKVAKFSNR